MNQSNVEAESFAIKIYSHTVQSLAVANSEIRFGDLDAFNRAITVLIESP